MLRTLMIALTLAAPASAHEWYTGQANQEGVSCCGGNDCASGTWSPRLGPDGIWEITITPGTHPKVTVEKYGTTPRTYRLWNSEHTTRGNPGISPDGFVHACIIDGDSDRLMCLFIGGSV
jgi:hypothetical protein